MGCSTRTFRRTLPVVTSGAGPGFVPFHQMRVNQASKARISIVVDSSTNYLRVRAAGRYGDVESDFEASPTPVGFPSDGSPTTQQDDGAAYGAGYRALDEDFQLVQLGVQVETYEGSAIQRGLVTVIVDLME